MRNITIKEASEVLTVSKATVRNWIKAGRISEQLYQGRTTHVSEQEILNLKEQIESGIENRLRSRRNKMAIDGNVIAKEYVSYKPYLVYAEQIIKCMGKLVNHRASTILVIIELALQFALQRGLICCEKHDSLTNALLANDVAFIECKGALQASIYRLLQMNELQLKVSNEQIKLSSKQLKLSNERFKLSSEQLKVLEEINALDVPYVEGEDFLGLVYMALCQLGERKGKGSYYTPTRVVEDLVGQVIDYVMDQKMGQVDLSRRISLVDPCCGTGNFLIQSYLILKERKIAANIVGYEIDAIAAAIAQINVALLQGQVNGTFLESAIVIENCDTLQSPESQRFPVISDKSDIYDSSGNDEKGFDIVIGNPPWGANQSSNNKVESFSQFIEWAYVHLNRQGTLAYVLPESILYVKGHQYIRKLLLEKMAIHSIRTLGNCFSKVYSPAITLIATKEVATQDHVIEVAGDGKITQNRLRFNPQHCMNILANDEQYNVLQHMKSLSYAMYLAGNADFALGIVTGNNKEHLLTDKLTNEEVILRGNHIYKYNIVGQTEYIHFRPNLYQQLAPIEMYRAGEKLFYRFINRNLVFAYDNQRRLSLNSANIIIPKLKGFSIKYIAAILNSRPAQFFFSNSFVSVKVLRSHIESIPIPPCPPPIQRNIEGLVDRILITEDAVERNYIYEQIDFQVMELYQLDERQRYVIKEKLAEVKYMDINRYGRMK